MRGAVAAALVEVAAALVVEACRKVRIVIVLRLPRRVPRLFRLLQFQHRPQHQMCWLQRRPQKR